MARQLSEEGLALTKGEETFCGLAYDDMRPNHVLVEGDTVIGTLTIGYGHTGPDVFIGQQIDEGEASTLLQSDMATAIKAVDANTPDTLTQHQFDACCDFAFNVGAHAFVGSTMDRLLNTGDSNEAAQEFLKWIKSGGKVLGGLVRRRKKEKILFLCADEDTPDYSQVTEDPDVWP